MSNPGRAAQEPAPTAEQVAALEREVADLRRQLAMAGSPVLDALAASPPGELEASYNEARYRALIELSPQFVWMTDAQGDNIYCNRVWYAFSGLTAEQTMGSGWTTALHPDDLARTAAKWQDHVASGLDYEIEIRFRRRDGEYRWHLCRGVPLKDSGGRVIRWLGIALDIHDRKTAAAEISQANERTLLAIESAEAGTWDYYPKTGKMECSPRTLALFKTPAGIEPTPESFLQVVHRRDRERVMGVIERAMDPAIAGDYHMDYRIVWPDKTVHWVFVKGKCYFSGEGAAREAERLTGIVFDVTGQKEAERDRASLFAALQNSPDFIGITDLPGRVLFLNRAGQELVGLKSDAEARTMTTFDFLEEKEGSIVRNEMLPLVRRRQVWEGEFSMRHFVTGEPILVETRVFGIFDEAGRLTSVANISRDISERTKLEEQLRLAQKMEAVGRLAGGVAHDFNNLLTVIRGAAEVLETRWQTSKGDLEIVMEISDAAERASGLTEQLLAFGRRQMVRPRAMDLNHILLRMQGMLKRLAGEDIVVEFSMENELAPVKMDPAQVDQILINLTTNARDAMPQGGVIKIRTFDEPITQATSPREHGPRVGLSFIDNGRGMEPEVLRHIFEPFFTTKEPGQGTGLGLSTVYGIVTQSGGEISVRSALNEGTAFTLYLPRTNEEPLPEKGVLAEKTVAHPACILLVEDEPSLRAVVAGYLREQGYVVHEASGAKEASGLAEEHRIDLLLTDIVMPETSGPALAASLTASHAQLAVIFMSGYAEHASLEKAFNQPNTLFLQKPFRLSALAAKIHESLTSKQAGPGESP